MRSINVLFLFLSITNVFAYSPTIASIKMSNDYLSKINHNHLPHEKRLEGIRNKITNYLKNTKEKQDKKLEKGVVSTYRPIPKCTFDTIFMNINQIQQIFISYNVDRMIFILKTGLKYVYYIDSKDDYNKMELLINLIPSNHKKIIINDVQNTMDDPFGYLFCEKK